MHLRESYATCCGKKVFQYFGNTQCVDGKLEKAEGWFNVVNTTPRSTKSAKSESVNEITKSELNKPELSLIEQNGNSKLSKTEKTNANLDIA